MRKKIDRDRAVRNLGIEAERRLLKSAVMKFRLEEETFKRLTLLAKKLNVTTSALLRQWVVEKIRPN